VEPHRQGRLFLDDKKSPSSPVYDSNDLDADGAGAPAGRVAGQVQLEGGRKIQCVWEYRQTAAEAACNSVGFRPRAWPWPRRGVVRDSDVAIVFVG